MLFLTLMNQSVSKHIVHETLKRLDYLEEEGSLYLRKITKVYTKDNEYEAFVYVYNHKVNNPNYLKNTENIYSWKFR